jgi:hypothetical protein
VPITKSQAQELTRAFVRDYPGALELAYKFRENTTELYGPRAVEVPAGMKGGYLSQETMHAGRAYKGRVDVPLQNVENADDLVMTLRHEVLGHYGANTFTPADKRALLNGLAAASNAPTLKPLWDDVNRRYANQPLDVRAEEVFALHCQGIDPSQHRDADRVQQRGQQSFTETCTARTRIMQADDLNNIACMVAQGLRDRSRTQQNFPQFKQSGHLHGYAMKQLGANLAVLGQDPRYARHSDGELAKAAYFRGLHEKASEVEGRPANFGRYDETMADRAALAKLPNVNDLEEFRVSQRPHHAQDGHSL